MRAELEALLLWDGTTPEPNKASELLSGKVIRPVHMSSGQFCNQDDVAKNRSREL